MKSAESTKLGTAGNSVVGQANTQGIPRTVNKPPGWQVWYLPQLSNTLLQGPQVGVAWEKHTEPSPHHPVLTQVKWD